MALHDTRRAGLRGSARARVMGRERSEAGSRGWVLRLLLPLAILLGLWHVVQQPALAQGARTVKLQRGGELPSISVSVGNTETLRTPVSFVDLVVGDPAIADVMPLTDRSFYVHGKKSGTTTISAYDADKQLVGTIEVEVGANAARLQRELRSRLPNARIKVSSINGQIELSGSVPDAPSVARAMTIARQFGPNTINSLTVTQSQQVMLEVRFIEVSRNAERNLGVNWDINGRSLTGIVAGTASNSTPFGTFAGHILQKGATVDVIIKALEQKGLGRTLAEPNLIAMSGQEASFLAGGEYPFLVAGAPNTAPTIQFKKYGVGLSFMPTVLADGLINLKIEPEVSELDRTAGINTATGPVFGIRVRRASTVVELKDGQSFAIAGLLKSTSSDNANQLPWIGSVPVLGSLFRSQAFQREETDLVIIVTPRLVRPAAPNQRLATPLDRTQPPNDVDRFVLGRQEVTPRQARRDANVPPRISAGHILDLAGAR